MIRNLLGFAIFAVIAIFLLKVFFGLFGLLLGLLSTVLFFAFIGFMIYLVLKLVAPARRRGCGRRSRAAGDLSGGPVSGLAARAGRPVRLASRRSA